MHSRPPLIGIFPDSTAALEAIKSLEQAGVPGKAIGVLARSHEQAHHLAQEAAADERLDDASADNRLEDLATWIAGVAGAVVPGVGPVVGTGGLASVALEAARARPGPGAVTGALVALNVPVEDAKRYDQRVMGGEILVVLEDDSYSDAAASILAP